VWRVSNIRLAFNCIFYHPLSIYNFFIWSKDQYIAFLCIYYQPPVSPILWGTFGRPGGTPGTPAGELSCISFLKFVEYGALALIKKQGKLTFP
jgi:hypothetical protein